LVFFDFSKFSGRYYFAVGLQNQLRRGGLRKARGIV
jgi:hypothetical protein